jgi:hypothetical protein
MPIDTPATELVRQLSRVGLRPEERLAQRIIEQGDQARAALLALATDVPALHNELPASLGPLHALRLLGELPDAAMIAPLLAGLPVPIINEQDVPARLYATEVLQIIGRVGAPAVPVLWAYADDEANDDMARVAALSALPFVATRDPATRDEIVAEARRRLEQGGSSPTLTGVVTILAELGDAASYKPIMAAYREGHVDKQQAPAAAVRQFLLGGGRRDLSCVNHPLFERYDHHGPRFRDPNEVDPDELG